MGSLLCATSRQVKLVLEFLATSSFTPYPMDKLWDFKLARNFLLLLLFLVLPLIVAEPINEAPVVLLLRNLILNLLRVTVRLSLLNSSWAPILSIHILLLI